MGNGAKILISTVPDQPINLRRDVTEVYSETKIALVWDAPGFNGNQPVLSYQLLQRDPVTTEWLIIQDELFALKHTVTGLDSGQSYNFSVKARNILGLSVKS